MKLSKKILCGVLCASMAASMMTACSNSTPATSDAGSGTSNSADASNSGTSSAATSDSSSGSSGNVIEAPSNGTVLKWCGYYDLNTNDKEMVDKFADEGYSVEYISTTSSEYFEKLAQLIASSDSPDLVSY